MKLGFVSAAFSSYSFEQVIDFTAENGMDCVELACWPSGGVERKYAGVCHVVCDGMTQADADRYTAYARAKNVTISGLGFYPNPLDSDPAVSGAAIAHLKKVIDASAMMGINLVNTFIGKDPAVPVSVNLERFAAVWPEIIRYAESRGVTVCIENCPMYFKDEWPGGKNLATCPAVWAEMFRIIPSKNFGLNYDPSHLVWQRMDYVRPIYDFADRIHHFHIKDVRFYQDKYDRAGIFAAPLEYMEPKLPGLGDIDWGRVISSLRDVGYNGCAVIEMEDRTFEGSLEDTVTAMQLSRDYCRNFVR